MCFTEKLWFFFNLTILYEMRIAFNHAISSALRAAYYLSKVHKGRHASATNKTTTKQSSPTWILL